MKKRSDNRCRVHLICNAHLDPVWLWEWQEGAAEAISTFRTAAELCEKNDGFIFNHNEVILYEWIREYEPFLFKRIQRLVKNGKWVIMGGWYLQPDCNMPSGESFVRQILAGRRYFKEHFGVEPKSAINFDPFGHSRGLVQILAKSGYKNYLFGRPDPDWLKLPDEDFVWEGFDGSRVLATRFPGGYGSHPGKAREIIERRIDKNKNRGILAVLWGVGNHGGGPSRYDLARIKHLIRERKDVNIKHSHVDVYFEELRKSGKEFPCWRNDLNFWAVGCYTSQIRVKQTYRELENEFFSTEKMLSCAYANGLIVYPEEEMNEALRNLLTCQFHDILPGSSVEPVEEGALRCMGRGLDILSRLKARAFFALSSGQKKAAGGQIPVFVFNPHGHDTRQTIECEFNMPDGNDKNTFTEVDVFQNDKKVTSQVEKEISYLFCEWRKRIIFRANLEAGRMNRFDCKLKALKNKPRIKLKPKNGVIHFSNNRMNIVINTRTGLIDSYKVNHREFFSGKAFSFVVFDDTACPWGACITGFHKKVGQFRLLDKVRGAEFSGLNGGGIDSVRVIEDGEVRSVVEAVLGYNNSFICVRYKLPKEGAKFEVELRVFWNEKQKALKMVTPFKEEILEYIGQTAYGVQQLDMSGNECVSQKWAAALSADRAFVCINNGIYGSSFKKNELRLTLLRSPVYSAHSYGANRVDLPLDRFSPHIDQGQRLFKFWFDGGDKNELLEKVEKEAAVYNEPCYALSFFPAEGGRKPKPVVRVEDKSVVVSAVKKAQKGNDVVIRLFNPLARKKTVKVHLPIINKIYKTQLGKFEIKTLKINLKTKNIKEVNLLENIVT
ncbi:MAG: alpha-mannosidase [Sedimentisphaerales bacterium]|nr:alpha-mannosidase [Sedimentisphaerales bacterium]